MEATFRNKSTCRIVCCTSSLLLLIFISCAKPIYQDRLPDALHHLIAGPLSGELTLDTSCNPFYIKMNSDCSHSGMYIVVVRDGHDMQGLLLCSGHEVMVVKAAGLGLVAGEKISYIKATSRFPAGAELPHTGGGAVIVGSKGNVRWTYYHHQWEIINPDGALHK